MGLEKLQDIEILTLYEYEARMYAFRLKQVDEDLMMHKQAWLNHQVTATKEQGKRQVPVYKKFDHFFNYEKKIKEIEKDIKPEKQLDERLKNYAHLAKRANEGR